MQNDENSIYQGGYAERSVKKTISSIGGSGGDIFVVSGPIKVIELIGVVTTNIGGTITRVKLLVDPTEPGTNTDICAQLDIDGDLAGTVYTITGTFGNAMVETTNGVIAGLATQFIVPAGVIEYANADNAETGIIDWHLRYKPLAPGVTVTAA